MVSIRKTKTALKFDTPSSWWASSWRDAIPTGNGIIGASVLGGAGQDTVMLTHNSLWWQGYVGVLPDVADRLKDVRDTLNGNNARNAEKMLTNALVSKNYRPLTSVPLPLCDFNIKMPIEKPVKDYMRVLNMENGEVSVAYKDGSTKYDRSMFVSRANDFVVYEINRSGAKAIDVEFSIDVHSKQNIRTQTGVSKLPEGVLSKYEKHFIYFSGRDENGMDYGAVARVSHYGGSLIVKDNSLKVEGANNVLVIIKIFVNSQREKEWKVAREQLANEKSNYDKMLKEHTSIHAKLFNTVDLDLEAEEREMSVEDMLREVRNGETPLALVEKLWAYGRHLFICSTRENGQICSPYGLWCGDYKAINAQSSADGVLQTIYSHALQGGYQDYLLSIFNYYENVIDDLRKTAGRLYGCRGIFIPSVTSPGMGLPGVISEKLVHFTGCAGWIAGLFYDYYLFTDDKKFLKERALPFMREVALFYEDFMKIDETDGKYTSSPSYSPNTTPGNYIEGDGANSFDIAQNATVDFAIMKQLLTNLIEGSNECGVNKNDLAKWQDMLTKIPNYKINEQGAFSEYISTKFTDNYTSKGTAMFYPVYPGTEIDFKTDPEMCKALLLAAKKRITIGFGNQTSMSFANLANVFARLGDGDTAYEVVSYIIKSSLMSNLVTVENDWRGMGVGANDYWATYQLQGNMGIVAALQNMLIYSGKNFVKFLSALPTDFRRGSVKSLSTRSGVEVSYDWDKRKGFFNVSIKAHKATMLDLIFPDGTKKVSKGTKADEFNAETCELNGVSFQAGKTVTYECKWSPVK